MTPVDFDQMFIRVVSNHSQHIYSYAIPLDYSRHSKNCVCVWLKAQCKDSVEYESKTIYEKNG